MRSKVTTKKHNVTKKAWEKTNMKQDDNKDMQPDNKEI